MALTNIACLLAKQLEDSQGRVLIMDWDLEAPGLHRFFPAQCEEREHSQRPGIIDYFHSLSSLIRNDPALYKEITGPGGWHALGRELPLQEFIVPDVTPRVDLIKAGKLDFSFPGKLDPQYSKLVASFDWVEFYRSYPGAIHAFRDLLTASYPYSLVDSRTGVTDVSGICTALLPEKVVAVFTPNLQSLYGLIDLLSKSTDYRRASDDFRPLAIFPLPSRIDIQEPKLKEKWLKEYQTKFEAFFVAAYDLKNCDLTNYFDEVQLPYTSYYAYGENIAVLEEERADSLSFSRAYRVFFKKLVELDTAWAATEAATLSNVFRADVSTGDDLLTAKVFYMRHERNPVFTGREEVLEMLRTQLIRSGRQAIYGLGGIGKTQIAVEYAYRYRHDYTAILWVLADSEQSIAGDFVNIAKALSLPEKDNAKQAAIVDGVRRWLDQNENWLLIFDQADNPEDLRKFLPQQRRGHILVTSRKQAFQPVGITRAIALDALSPEAAIEFLLKRTGREPTKGSRVARELAKELGYFPLALEQAGAFIVENQTGFEDYLKSFRRSRLSLLQQQGPVLGDYKNTLDTTWAINFAEVEKFPVSADLLRLSAFLAPEMIPLELLEKGKAEAGEPFASKLEAVAEDPVLLDELLKPLADYSLIRRNSSARSYSIHPLVQQVVRDNMGTDTQRSWAERTVRMVSRVFPRPEFENWQECERLLPHALQCSKHAMNYNLESWAVANVLRNAGSYLHQRARYAEAVPLLQRALAILERVEGQENAGTADCLNSLAWLYDDQGKYAQAEPLSRRALAIKERVLGPGHPDTATSLDSLAKIYRDQRRYAEAEPLAQRALAIREKVLGPEHPDTATSLNNLAALYRAENDYSKANLLYQRALEIREKVLGPEHPATATNLNNLAILYNYQGKYAEAEPLFRRALAIYESAVGMEHPSTADSLSNLAMLYHNQQRNADAEPLYRRALAIYEKVLGTEHPATAKSMTNLAEIYRAQGKRAEADALEQRVKNIAMKK
ncbi:MAG TPA: FxSxx-COOH system tetratricopeptide repeat protein [Candidatus Angelobacter sp.]|jgi:tetratricopeptide (TPR) repeat protein